MTRFLADCLGALTCGFGLLFTVLAFAGTITPIPGLGAVFFWPGLILLAIGVVISRSSSRKTCPQCAERVKFAAGKCRYCGHEFVAEPVREPAAQRQ